MINLASVVIVDRAARAEYEPAFRRDVFPTITCSPLVAENIPICNEPRAEQGFCFRGKLSLLCYLKCNLNRQFISKPTRNDESIGKAPIVYNGRIQLLRNFFTDVRSPAQVEDDG